MIHPTDYAALAGILGALASILVYLRTGMGPLDVGILALIHMQAALMGVRVELWRAGRRAWRHHGLRVRAIQASFATRG